MEKVRVIVEMDKELHRQLKIKTATDGTTMSAILVGCVKNYVGILPDRTNEERADYKPGK